MSGADAPKVLLIEDERDLVTVYERWLADDYDVRAVHDGETAKEMLDSTVEVVVLDRLMPGVSGDEVLAHIRERRYGCRVAIVSAVEPDFDVLGMGFDAYLTKPIDRVDLVGVVEKLRRRNDYTDRVQEYFSLVSKKALLDATKTEAEREESDRYADLVGRIAELEVEVERIQSELTEAEDFEVAFRDIAAEGPTE